MARNHVGSGVRVSWKIVPDVTGRLWAKSTPFRLGSGEQQVWQLELLPTPAGLEATR